MPVQAEGLHYVVVYRPSIAWWFPAAGVIFVALGIGLALLAKARVFGFGLAALATVWVASAAHSMWTRYREFNAAIEDSSAAVVEGVVQDFVPAPFGGHQDESFRVDSVHFSYSDYVLNGGFNTTRSHGGPIHPGLQVRIHYVGKAAHATIVELETAE